MTLDLSSVIPCPDCAGQLVAPVRPIGALSDCICETCGWQSGFSTKMTYDTHPAYVDIVAEVRRLREQIECTIADVEVTPCP